MPAKEQYSKTPGGKQPFGLMTMFNSYLSPGTTAHKVSNNMPSFH